MSLSQDVSPVEEFHCQLPQNSFTTHSELLDAVPEHQNSATIMFISPKNGMAAKSSRWRQPSFTPPEQCNEERHVAAYKVSNLKRYAQVATAVVMCWLSSGIVFGFAALKPVLVAEGVYSELCGIDSSPPTDTKLPCAEQDLRLNLFFIVASITANVSSLFAGAILDRFGRRACWLLSAVFLMVGCLLMSLSFASREFDGYLTANIFLALGGTFIFVPSFQLANAFPMYSGTIVALITGAFDASAAVFLIYRIIYTATDGRFSVEQFFFGYAAIPVFIVIAELTYMPRHAYHTFAELEHKIEMAQDAARDVHGSDDDISDTETLMRTRIARAERRADKVNRIEDIAGNADEREERVKIKEGLKQRSRVWGALHGIPAHRQMLTPWFVLILFLTVIQMLRMNYFIATIRAQYRFMLDSEKQAELMNGFFDVALPMGGVLSTPFIGLLLNNLSVTSNFGILTGFIVAIGALNCVPYVWAGYSTIVAFVIFRPLYYSAISDYATKVFGFATFGRIYGTLVSLSGLANFAQSGLDTLTHGPLNGDPTPINAAFGVGGAVISIGLTLFIAIKSRVSIEEDEQDYETQKLLFAIEHSEYGTTD